MGLTSSDIVGIILAIFLPPLAVFMERGCGFDLLINVILCCFAWFPGMIHALYITGYKVKISFALPVKHWYCLLVATRNINWPEMFMENSRCYWHQKYMVAGGVLLTVYYRYLPSNVVPYLLRYRIDLEVCSS